MKDRYNRRYPKGTPLGGQFIPRVVSIPSVNNNLVNRDQKSKKNYRPMLPPSSIPLRQMEPFLRSDDYLFARGHVGERVTGSLVDSLLNNDMGGYDKNKHLWLEKNGLDQDDLSEVLHRVSDHASMLYATQIKARPEIAKRIAKYDIIFSDFGHFPLDAVVDHDNKIISLNRKMFLDKKSKQSYDGSILSAITHEYAHAIDHSFEDGNVAAFTNMFRDLHGHLREYIKNGATPKWLLQSKLAYPLNGYYGLAKKDGVPRQLSKEYVSVISEMYWHNPEYLKKLDDKFRKDGYAGPSMTEMMQKVWGNVDTTLSPVKLASLPKNIDESRIPIKSITGKNDNSFNSNFDSSYSIKDYRNAITI